MKHSLSPCNILKGDWVNELVESISQSCGTSEESHAFRSDREGQDLDSVRDWEGGVCHVVKPEVASSKQLMQSPSLFSSQ